MTVKIDGTNGIDTAQLRAPDGDPVAMTIDNAGKVAFPVGIKSTELTAEGNNFALVSQQATKIASLILTPGIWELSGVANLQSTAALIGWQALFISDSAVDDGFSTALNTYVPNVVLNTGGSGAPTMQVTRTVSVNVNTEYSLYVNYAFSNGNACGAAGGIRAVRIG